MRCGSLCTETATCREAPRSMMMRRKWTPTSEANPPRSGYWTVTRDGLVDRCYYQHPGEPPGIRVGSDWLGPGWYDDHRCGCLAAPADSLRSGDTCTIAESGPARRSRQHREGGSRRGDLLQAHWRQSSRNGHNTISLFIIVLFFDFFEQRSGSVTPPPTRPAPPRPARPPIVPW